MKFLCDRCKTRYSIADERVRGKVLKIRCKSCSHVITVREGMTDEDPDAVHAAPAPRPAVAAATKSALADAFAQEMQPAAGRDLSEPPAPPALEEEWYVSLDGNQQGPFSLTDAQAWVAAKKLDDDLYCWSEGFDDWLPVDKVSHFRGLRQKPAAKPRPPAPGGAKPGAAAKSAKSDEPQPLFAATLAALEAEVEAADAKPGRKGAADAAAASRREPAKDAGVDRKAESPSNGKAAAKPGAGSTAAASAAIAALSPAKAAASRFDLGEDSNKGDEPELQDDDDDEDSDKDELEIGEVSRVVRLPDLMAAHQRKVERQATSRTGANAAIRTPAPAIARGTGGVAALTAAASVPDGTAAALDPLAAAAVLGDALHPVPPVHKHTTLYIVAGALATVLVGIVLAVILGGPSGGEDPIAVGNTERFDNLGRRIDDPQRKGGSSSRSNDNARTGGRTGTNILRPPRLPTGGSTSAGGATAPGKTEVVIGPDGQPLQPLTVDDVLQVSARMSSGTRRCYERALKEDPFLKVTKITVDLVVENSGIVSKVALDRTNQDTLSKCLTGAIGRWRFRLSTKQESFRFPLVFEQR